ncbi:MAG: hypothetical protein IKT46_10185 [Clostridia bacterium]|nr:hypothetical protein [Clostridia bacterium]
MGIFSKKVCVNCGKECGMFGRTSTRDEKVLCSSCAKLAGEEFESYSHTYKQYLDLVERYNENEKKLQSFNIDKVYYKRIFVDLEKEQIAFTEYPVISNKDMYKEHPHVYDLKDLKFFDRRYQTTKEEGSILGTTVYIDILMTMVFEDKYVPCPISGAIETNRRVEIKGVFKKRAEGFCTQDDLDIILLANDILNAKGLKRPLSMEKGDKIESLDEYAPWFKMMFSLEKKKILDKKLVNSILENLAEDTGLMNSINLPFKIRERYSI